MEVAMRMMLITTSNSISVKAALFEIELMVSYS
jgi:hypothetical protein